MQDTEYKFIGPHHTEAKGLYDGGHNILKCKNCRKDLADIWVTAPHLEFSAKYWATCPFCQGSSYKVEIKGKTHIGGIGIADPNSPTDDDKRTVTVIGRTDYDNDEVKLTMLKGK